MMRGVPPPAAQCRRSVAAPLGGPARGLLAAAVLAACARPGAASLPLARVVAAPAESASVPPARVLPPPSAREAAIAAELERDVRALCADGQRNAKNPWALAGAADHVAGELETAGHAVERQGWERDGVVMQNLEVSLRGGRRGDELIVVGAHYDSAEGTPGADDNASGVAALLALSRAFAGRSFERSVRLVAFAAEEAPYFQTESMGSLQYARRLAAANARVGAMLSLESLGYYSDEPGSQTYPHEASELGPAPRGDFVALVSRREDAQLVARALAAFERAASVPARGVALAASAPGVGWSDHWSFWQIGAAALMVTDTAPFRNPHHHTPGDVPERLDYARLARAVVGIEAVIVELAGP
jgi:hypothetical protein